MLTSKQRAFLRSQAHSLKPITQIGKGGISQALINQVDTALEARELLKGKVLNNSLLSAREVAEKLAELCHAEIVQVIGNKFVLYRRNQEEAVYLLP